MEMKRITAVEQNGLDEGYYLSTCTMTGTDHSNMYNLQRGNNSLSLKSILTPYFYKQLIVGACICTPC